MEEERSYDLFISSAKADEEWVKFVLIPAIGLSDERILTQSKFKPGTDKISEFERAIIKSRYTLLILTPAFLNNKWTSFSETIVSFSRVKQQRNCLIPLFLEPCQLPLHLDFIQKLNCIDKADYDQEFARLRNLLEQPLLKLEPIDCPYPGMKPFTKDDARFFYGREEEIEQLRLCLRKQNYFFIIGTSGSGKSSFIFAGLVPELEKKQPGKWLVKSLRPGQTKSETPMQKLAEALGEKELKDVSSVEQYSQLVNSLLAQHPSEANLLLIIDQFEELFSPSTKKEQKQLFITAIKTLRQVEKIRLFLAMRADFYPELMNSELWPLQEFERVEITPLDRERLRKAIVTPAANCGVYIEAKLLERLLSDAAADHERGVLPLLQETMVLLWEEMEHHFLTLDAYEKLGKEASKGHPNGLAVAIARHADGTLQKLSLEQQKIARRIFIRLVQFGEGRANTRRQQTKKELRSLTDSTQQFENTLEYLVENRLLTPASNKDMKDEETPIDIAHEILIESWPTFNQWLKEWRKAENIRRQLIEKADTWEGLKREGGLLDKIELKEANDWLNSDEAKQLGYSNNLSELVQASRNAINKARIRLSVLVVLIILSVIGALFLFQQQNIQALFKNSIQEIAKSRAAIASDTPSLAMRHIKKVLDLHQKNKKVLGEPLEAKVLLAGLINSGIPHVLTEMKSIFDFDIAQHGEFIVAVGQTGESEQATLRLINLNSNKPSIDVTGDYAYNAVAVSPSGQIAVATIVEVSTQNQPKKYKYVVKLFDSKLTLQKTIKLPVQKKPNRWEADRIITFTPYQISELSFTRDGQKLIMSGAASPSEMVNLPYHWRAWYDVKTGKITGQVDADHELSHFAPYEVVGDIIGERYLASDGKAEIYLDDLYTDNRNLLGYQPEDKIPGVTGIAGSPSGNKLAAVGTDNKLSIFEVPVSQNVPLRIELPNTSAGEKVAWVRNDLLAVTRADFSTTLFSLKDEDYFREGIMNLDGENFQFRFKFQIFRGHKARINSILASPTGKSFATASEDRTVRVTWINPHREMTLHGNTRSVRKLAFSKDGTMVFASGLDGKLRSWLIESPYLQAWPADDEISEPEHRATKTEWDTGGGLSRQARREYRGYIRELIKSNDNNLFASQTYGGLIMIRDAQGQAIWRFDSRQPREGGGREMAFSANGDWLLTSFTSLELYGIKNKERKTIQTEKWPVDLSLNNQWASESSDGKLSLHPLVDLNDEKELLSGRFSPNGRWFATISGKIVRYWDLRKPDAPAQTIEMTKEVNSSSWVFAQNADVLLLMSNDDSILFLIDIEGGTIQQTFSESDLVPFFSISRNGKWVAVAEKYGSVHLWSADGRTKKQFDRHARYVSDVDVSEDGRWLISGSRDRTVRLWETESGSFVESKFLNPVESVFLDPKRNRFLVGSGTGVHARFYPQTVSYPLDEQNLTKEKSLKDSNHEE